jgi:hypothetical protein
VGLLHEVARIPKRERYDGGPRSERVAECIRIQCRRDVVYRKIPVCEFFHHVDVALDGGAGSKQRSDTAQRALIRRSGGKLGG